MKLRTTSIADADVAEAALWLENEQAGLGSVFLDAVAEAFTKIADGPLTCPTLNAPNISFKVPLRSKMIGRFPYRAIFALQGDDIIVVGVLHGHRDLETILRSRVGTA